MSKPRKITIVRYHLPDGTKCKADTPGAIRSSETSAKYYGEVTLPNGRRKRVPLCSDYKRSSQILAKLIGDAVQRKHGIGDPYEEHHARPIIDHLDEWEADLLARGNTLSHAKLTVGYARQALAACKFIMIPDINASKLQAHLADLKKAGKSVRTTNAVLQGCKQFVRWLMQDQRTGSSPLAHLKMGNMKLDQRHQRRELQAEEIRRLLASARYGPERRGLSGPDREMLYRVGMATGLRASELVSLTPQSFDLSSSTPTVTIEAQRAKNRRRDTLPLQADLAERLRTYLAGRPVGATIWRKNSAKHFSGVDLIRFDLEQARATWIAEAQTPEEREKREGSDFLAYQDSDGRFADFHCLRHTFISVLVRANTPPKVAQRLARHSTITLTMDRYAHTALHDIASAVQALPTYAEEVGQEEAQQARKTGTDDDSGCPNVAHRTYNARPSLASTGQNASSEHSEDDSPQLLSMSSPGTIRTVQSSMHPGQESNLDLLFKRRRTTKRKHHTGQQVAPIDKSELPKGCPHDPDLERIISLWPTLATPIRRAILALLSVGE